MRTVLVKLENGTEIRVPNSTASDLVVHNSARSIVAGSEDVTDDPEEERDLYDVTCECGSGKPLFDVEFPLAVLHRGEWYFADGMHVENGEEIDFLLRGERLLLNLDECMWVCISDLGRGTIGRSV